LELIKVAVARIENHTYFHRSPENLQYSTQLMTIPPLSKPGSNQVASVLPVLPVQQDAQYPVILDVRANINSTDSSNLMRRLREDPCYNRPLTDRVQGEGNESRTTDNHRRIIHHPKRRIVIGYVFGSKKMSTMSVVMAEASKVKLYYSKRTGKITTTTCHAAGGTFTDTTSATASTDCTTTTTSTTEGCCDVPNTNSKSKNHLYFSNHCNDRPSNGDSVDATEDTMAFVTATKSTASSSHSYCSSLGTTLTQARLSKHSMDHNCHLTSDQVGKPMTIPTMDRSDRTTTTTTTTSTNTDTTSHKVDTLTNTIVVTPNSSNTTNSASSRVSWSSCCTGQSSSTTSSSSSRSSSSSSSSSSSPREEEDEEEENNQYEEFIPIRVSFVPLDLGTFVAGWYFFCFLATARGWWTVLKIIKNETTPLS
jgi:hypothetical protein